MAWPPPVLPINRTNATPQIDTHPADHNAVNQAVNDAVAELGANPSGAYATVDARLAAEASHIVHNDSTTWTETVGALRIVSSISYATATDQYGNINITFPYAFSKVPIVSVWSQDNPVGTYQRVYVHVWTTLTGSGWIIANSTTGAGFASTNLWVCFSAIGPK